MKWWKRIQDIPDKLNYMTMEGRNKLILLSIIVLLWIPVIGILLGIMSLEYVLLSIVCTWLYIGFILIKRLW